MTTGKYWPISDRFSARKPSFSATNLGPSAIRQISTLSCHRQLCWIRQGRWSDRREVAPLFRG